MASNQKCTALKYLNTQLYEMGFYQHDFHCEQISLFLQFIYSHKLYIKIFSLQKLYIHLMLSDNLINVKMIWKRTYFIVKFSSQSLNAYIHRYHLFMNIILDLYFRCHEHTRKDFTYILKNRYENIKKNACIKSLKRFMLIFI